VLGRFGQLFCIELRTGKRKWAWDWRRKLQGTTLPTWSYSSSPYVKGEHLFVEPGGKGNSVVCLDKNSGKVLWQAGDDAAAYATPRVLELAGRPTLVSFNAFGLVGRSPADGSEFWRARWKTNYDVNSASPQAVGKDRVFISSGYGTGCAMFKVTGSGLQELWKNREMKNKHTVSVLHDGALYGFDESDLACVDADTGRQLWKKKGYGKGGLILAGGKLVIQGENGRIAIGDASKSGFDADFDEEVFDKFHCWNHPVLSNGRLFVKDVKGRVVAFAVK
jgi:outer membrane protein assembly factor BamB